MEVTVEKRNAFPFGLKRLGVYLGGLLLYAFGVCLMARANIGISPLTSIAYVFTLFTPASLGVTQFVMNVLLVLVQVVWLRREFEKIQLLQIVASVLFSVFIDMMTPLVQWMAPDPSLPARIGLFAAAMLVMGVAIGLTAIANVALLPGDGVARTIAYKLKWPFGKGKVLNDCLCVVVTCVLSLVFLQRIEGIQVGTVIAAFALGTVARFFMRYCKALLERFMRRKGDGDPGTEPA